ncbi:MAG TPA: histidine kinase [Flavisolibacter sp.]|nr:histidine kinase [Flavisolibacter sp.]
MNEKKLRIFGPLFLFAFLLVFFYGMFIKGFSSALVYLSISAFYALLCWESTVRVVYLSRKKSPGIANTRKRLLFLAAIGLPVAFLVGFVDHFFSFKIGTYTSILLEDYGFIAGLNIMCSIIVVGVYEGVYYIQNWKVLYAESEEIKKINLTNQFQLLKEQVKPHFLFNSLNTLISLIPTQPNNAIRFAEELSSVYRYLLRKNLRELSTVREELQFIQLFLSLLKTRFQDSLQVEIEVAEEDEDALVPPFVLQLLVENAVKHNIVSEEQPLKISIQSQEGSLVVRNNLQKKRSPELSEKTGLLNLMERYKLLRKDHLLEITEDETSFRVTLPLIQTGVKTAVAV